MRIFGGSAWRPFDGFASEELGKGTRRGKNRFAEGDINAEPLHCALLLVCKRQPATEEFLASLGIEKHAVRGPSFTKVLAPEFAPIAGAKDEPVRHLRAPRFHQVASQRWAAVIVIMHETECRIETERVNGGKCVGSRHGVGQTQHR